MSKFDIENFVYFGRLFEIYGKLLSQDRQVVMNMYFNCNMTLAEIADERKVTRQAILDAVEKSCSKLKEYEDTLHVLKDRESTQNALQEILKLTDLKQIKQKVENILKEE